MHRGSPTGVNRPGKSRHGASGDLPVRAVSCSARRTPADFSQCLTESLLSKGLLEWAHSLELMGSVRIANNDRESALEVAAGYVENGVRRATTGTCTRVQYSIG